LKVTRNTLEAIRRRIHFSHMINFRGMILHSVPVG
jgi:dynein heavy chain